jgi:hypothetical protein
VDGKAAPYPSAVFPIAGVLRYVRLFVPESVNDALYGQASELFFDEYEEAPLSQVPSNEERFLTALLLLLLIERFAKKGDWSLERVERFTTRLVSILNRLSRTILNTMLREFELLCNRFATAKFQAEALIADFNRVLGAVKAALAFPSSVSAYFFAQFAALLDAKMLNKLIANPSRFTFTNAIEWNTFVTGIDFTEGLNLRLLKQAVGVLMMGKNLTDPGTLDVTVEAVCPDLNPKLTFFLLKNFQPDAMMPDPIDAGVFRKRYQVQDVPTVQAVVAKSISDPRVAGKGLNLSGWNRVAMSGWIQRAYPWLKAQIAAPRT